MKKEDSPTEVINTEPTTDLHAVETSSSAELHSLFFFLAILLKQRVACPSFI